MVVVQFSSDPDTLHWEPEEQVDNLKQVAFIIFQVFGFLKVAIIISEEHESGLEKYRVFSKKKPAQWVLLGFIGFLGHFWVFRFESS